MDAKRRRTEHSWQQLEVLPIFKLERKYAR